MTDLRKLFEDFGQAKVQDIRQALSQNKINATGRLSASVQAEVVDRPESIRVTVSALAYIATVDIGRGPTRSRGGDFTVEDIKTWLAAKRIPVPAGLTFDRYAFLIYRKINREGTAQFRRQPRTFVADAVQIGIPEFEAAIADAGADVVLTFLAQWQRL